MVTSYTRTTRLHHDIIFPPRQHGSPGVEPRGGGNVRMCGINPNKFSFSPGFEPVYRIRPTSMLTTYHFATHSTCQDLRVRVSQTYPNTPTYTTVQHPKSRHIMTHHLRHMLTSHHHALDARPPPPCLKAHMRQPHAATYDPCAWSTCYVSIAPHGARLPIKHMTHHLTR